MGNGTSPTSVGTTTTASLSGASQTSLNSEATAGGGGGGSPPRPLRNKKAAELHDNNGLTTEAAPIATVEEGDEDLKLDGGEADIPSASPPSCTRLDEASQACV